MPLRGKADENATSKHLRQLSGSALSGTSKTLQKEAVGVKNNIVRAALGEVTTTAVNRRVRWLSRLPCPRVAHNFSTQENNSKVLLGKEKDEVSLKRGRSNSTNNAVQRVPLGPGRSQIAPPVTSTAPIRAAPGRSSRPSTLNASRRSIRDTSRPIAIYEDVDMDVEDQLEPVVVLSEEIPSEAASEADANFLTSEPDGNDMVLVEAEDEDTETVAFQESKAPKVWPDLATQHRLDCERQVETIREVFDDDDDEFDPTMVSEYAEEIFEYMSGLEVRLL